MLTMTVKYPGSVFTTDTAVVVVVAAAAAVVVVVVVTSSSCYKASSILPKYKQIY